MATATVTRSPAERNAAGFAALAAALGESDATAFLGDLLSARGGDMGIPGRDLAAWLREHEKTIDEYEARILRLQAERKA